MLEMLMDPLGAIMITFFVMSIISILGIIFLHTSKNEKWKKGLVYFLSVWSVIIAYCGVLSTPFYMTEKILFTVALGAMAIVAVFIFMISKKENKFQIVKWLISISVVAGMVNCFLF